jgi:hypothetical protein
MLTQEELFARALMVEKLWVVDKIQFDQVAEDDIEKGGKFSQELSNNLDKTGLI